MLDGIHTTGAYSPIVKSGTERQPAPVEAPRTLEHSGDESHKGSTVSAIYYSPAVQIDPEANVAIFVVRNSETGAVINQFPSKQVVEEYKRADAKKDAEIKQHAQKASTPVETPKAEAAPVQIPAPAPEVQAVEVKAVSAPVKDNA